ncbi:hypothetical protein [Oceanicoccus sagamiensis]|uniref:Lipoprotein n=1 Tax=Oceanicoccus sagamiensis TaxID=716816 RepID=A0A1X9N4H4_9GAMM|nr:hypothetical protein [Oceanicoccus sagamiensis]ARN72656.1 hypothetical protein BST96_00115 [Oceanicoccus sagamiensis]
MNARLVILILCVLSVAGCVSQVVSFKDYVEGWKGEDISKYIEVRERPHLDRSKYKGEENVENLSNGNKVYQFPYPKCPVYFEVNSNGVIIDITTPDGKDCY